MADKNRKQNKKSDGKLGRFFRRGLSVFSASRSSSGGGEGQPTSIVAGGPIDPDGSRLVLRTREDVELLVRSVASVATALWRVRAKLLQDRSSELPEDLRNLPRHVESAWDALWASSVEVRDHTGQRYVAGMALKVVAFQPTAGIGTEVIQETIKPSVFYKDKLVQRGEVIVGTPMERGAEAASASPTDRTPTTAYESDCNDAPDPGASRASMSDDEAGAEELE